MNALTLQHISLAEIIRQRQKAHGIYGHIRLQVHDRHGHHAVGGARQD